eukprot:CAMPEP_0170323472 /NCGR_PEP_ID=MMETSP0116_2-20130129/62544_1 /TAXON_ID=400756 /ORGANISM="Durinskia baltica, Strain CSIRO CS-38" /LENGTH=69 /DNA_ID=CAMNT_0010576391 /DNA_START=40 /DNA_END=249 /DNA_ORIENTATION=-
MASSLLVAPDSFESARCPDPGSRLRELFCLRAFGNVADHVRRACEPVHVHEPPVFRGCASARCFRAALT